MNVEDNLKAVSGMVKSGARGLWRAAVYVLVSYSIIIGLFFLVALGALHVVGIETGVPEHLQSQTVLYGYLTLLFLNPAEMLRNWLSKRRYKLLHGVDPANGDAALWKVSPSVWEDMSVKTVKRDDAGDVHELDRSTDNLTEIDVKTASGTRTGYECEYYDEDSNTAYYSYHGDVSNTEIRREMVDGVEYLKYEASVEREWHETFRRNFFDILESSVAKRANHIIHVFEDDIVPSKLSSIREDIRSATGEAEIDDIVDGKRDHSDDIGMDNPFEEQNLSVTVSQGDGDE